MNDENAKFPMAESEFDPSGPQAQQVDDLNQQALDVFYQHPDQAAQLFEQAISLAQSGEFALRPYLTGLTASLAGLAKLLTDDKPDLAARYCLQILSLLDGHPVIPPLIDAKNSLGWIYYHLGDYSTAMEWAHQALHHSQDLSLPAKESIDLDLIANIYGDTGQFPQALQAHETALLIAQSAQDQKSEAHILNNMAMTQLAMGDYQSALKSGQKCLQMFRDMNMVLAYANSLDTLALIHLALGDFAQAEANLINGLKIIEPIENSVVNTYLLKSLGRVYLAQNDLSGAAAKIEQARVIAEHNGLRGELAECHQLLASIHERQSDYILALQHFKQFHEINQEITGDTAAKRLAILDVIHAVENAKKEAEIFRLRNIELQSEIDERKHIQKSLEVLARYDPLTSLYNRRYFLEKSEQEYERAIRFGHPITVIMADLDHFKLVNDTYGHAVGDQVLESVGKRIKEIMRNRDIAGRMGGEEFALVLSETTLDGGIQAADRLCESFARDAFPIKTHSIQVTISVGLTTLVP